MRVVHLTRIPGLVAPPRPCSSPNGDLFNITKFTKRFSSETSALKQVAYPISSRDTSPLPPGAYYTERGLQYVTPYLTATNYGPRREWNQKRLIGLPHSIWGTSWSQEAWKAALDHGIFLINDQKASESSVIPNGGIITHLTHRHEPPVLQHDLKSRILQETPEYYIFDKPPSVPIHRTGNYNYNTLMTMIQMHFGFQTYTIHRLDSLMSGLLILAKSRQAAAAWGNKFDDLQNELRLVRFFLARVEGVPKMEQFSCDASLGSERGRGKTLYKVDRNAGLSASSKFRVLSSDGKTSIILCRTVGGRTHQTRIHLAHLGFPIVNDRLYNGTAESPSRKIYHYLSEEFALQSSVIKSRADVAGLYRPRPTTKQPLVEHFDEMAHEYALSKCKLCRTVHRDPFPEELMMHNHALAYQFGDEFFLQTPIPSWAASEVTEAEVNEAIKKISAE